MSDTPQIIPGSQIAPGSDTPHRFALFCWEMHVENWSLDFLLVDQHGLPTLVEAKLAENPESRRAVVGQIIEYATNAAETWADGRLREKADSYWTRQGKDVQKIRGKLIDEEEIEDFWTELKIILFKAR